MVVWYFEQKIREKHVSLGERHPAKPASGAAAAKGKNKGNKTEKHWRLRTTDDTRSMLSRTQVWNEARCREEARIKRRRRGFATVQLSTTEFLGKRDPDRKQFFMKGKPANMRRLSQRVVVPKRMPVTTGIHVSVLLASKRELQTWNHCAFKQTEKAGGEPQKRTNAVVVAQTLDHTQAEKENTSLKIHSEGKLSARCVSDSSDISFREHWE